jgi:LPS export ABC transporter protein LptC
LNLRSLVLLALLVVAAVGSWYTAERNRESPGEVTYTASEYLGYYLKGARILGTGPDGTLLYEIVAARAEQLPDDRIEFADVRIRYSPETDVPWTIDSDTAILFPDTQRVRLEGNVTAVSERETPADETEISSPYLDLEPKNFIATTDARVQIRVGTQSITGIGMLASLDDDRVELRSDVSGRFTP